MYPVLYNSNETNFIHNGLGLLTGTISAIATEELNGMFELNMEYDSEGFLADIIQEEMFIKAKANDKQDEQLFRIYSITKNHENDNLIIAGQHVTYDLGNNFVEELHANNLTKKQVMELIGSSTAYPHPFDVTSTNTTTQSSTSLYRTNPLQMIGGMEGSVLQIWGGQIERDNFRLVMHDRRGSDDGVLVTYKKNLTGLNAKFDISSLKTRIFPFVFKEATDDEPEQLITVPGKYIDSPHINDYEMPYILPVDFSSEEDIETAEDLLNVASGWFVETGRDKPKVEMEVQFEHLWETEEYKDVAALELVGMGDTITVRHGKLNVEGTAIVNRIEYDVLAEKNLAVDVGSVKARFSDRINNIDDRTNDINDKIEVIEKDYNESIKRIDGKNTIYYGPDEPTGDLVEGDLWFRVVDGEYTRTYRYDGIQWQLVVSKEIKDIEETANNARNRANEAVENANIATRNATEAIEEAQKSFDKAQDALSTAGSALDLATTIRGNMTTLSKMVDEQTGEISTIKQSVQGLRTDVSDAQGNASSALQLAKGLQTRVTDAEGNISSVTQLANTLQSDLRDAEGNISTLQQTATDYARRLENAEGDISSVTQLATGLQTRVSDVEGNVSSVTQLANALQTRMADAEGNINTLTQTSKSLDSTIKSVRDDLDDLEIGGRNILGNSKKPNFRTNNSNTHPLKITEFDDYRRYEPQGNSGLSTYSQLNDSTYPIYDKSWLGRDMGVSITVRVSKDVKLRFRFADWGKTPSTLIKEGYFDVKASDGWTTLKMPVPKSLITRNPDTEYIRFLLYTADNGNSTITPYDGTIDVKDWFIGFGTKVPDWSPAPEDLATQSQISQLADNINLRVQKGDVVNQINIDTSGVLISGKKLILDGDTTVTGTFRVGNANITNLNAGKITAGTLDVGKLTVIGLTANSIVGGILQSQNNSVTFNLNNGNLSMGSAKLTFGGTGNNFNGRIDYSGEAFRFQRDPYTYLHINRGGASGGAGVSSRRNLFAMMAKGTNMIRFGLSDDGYDHAIITGGTVALKMLAGSTRELQIRHYGDNAYADLRAQDVGVMGQLTVSRNVTFQNQLIATENSHLYIRPHVSSSNEVRIADTAGRYHPLRAASFPTGSLAEYKDDIRAWNESALAVINQSTIYQYRLKGTEKLRYGLVIGEGYNTPKHVIDGDGVEQYAMNSVSWKAIQEVDEKIELTREELILKVARLEARINKLEAA
ncbi:phage tail spike protein [Oceanobacillus indicireducens]|uniref:Peptidase S74 domain-containing protein n=1 Tax=Oceanobacillus indicireducens TaxID=1004261 RepID=A0A917Y026_9BACI|nr:phage tail spike protein [Oceanobacillus indicireducens]GGN59290.1 hypothetical protein GCM10007971_22240 [Oceanobacillus indicireducens]